VRVQSVLTSCRNRSGNLKGKPVCISLFEIHETHTTFNIRRSTRVISLSKGQGIGVCSHRDIVWSSIFCNSGEVTPVQCPVPGGIALHPDLIAITLCTAAVTVSIEISLDCIRQCYCVYRVVHEHVGGKVDVCHIP
jgi:hypothetical protein